MPTSSVRRSPLPLVVALHVDLVAHLVEPGEPGPPVRGELTVRHLVGGSTPADQGAHQAERHHAAEQPITSEAAHSGGVHRDDEPHHTDHGPANRQWCKEPFHQRQIGSELARALTEAEAAARRLGLLAETDDA